MDGKVDVLGHTKIVCCSFSVIYKISAPQKEWTEYRGVIFTLLAYF